MTPLMAPFTSRAKGHPSVWCDWYRRPASVANGQCTLCKSRSHRPLSEVTP